MKTKQSIRLLCIFIAVLTGLSVFVSCGENESGNDETTTETNVDNIDTVAETTDPTLDAKGFKRDNIPEELDYGGKTVTLLYWSDRLHQEFDAAEPTGENVNDAIFFRNMAVEDRLGINTEFVSTQSDAAHIDNWLSYVQTDIQSGAKSFDIMGTYSRAMAATASAGYCTDLLDDECQYLDFDMPWWPERLITEATINNKLYFASGDISAGLLWMMYACFVNENIVKDLDLPSVYDLVDSNEWTYDKFIEMCNNVYLDNDGDGAKSVGDRYGYMSYGIHLDPWFYGSGALIVDKDSEGNLKPADSFGGEKVISTIEKLNNLFWSSNDAIYTTDSTIVYTFQSEFNNGNLLFAIDRSRLAALYLDSSDLKFSIVPTPKYDSNQSSFITTVGNGYSLYAIPISASSEDLPMLSAWLETDASESFRQVTPQLYEVTLKIKYAQDETAARMYDLIRSNISFDLGRIFDSSLIGQHDFRNMIQNNQNNWSSVVKSKSKALSALLEKLITELGD